jgi:uncharacterized protein (DUF1800 family)
MKGQAMPNPLGPWEPYVPTAEDPWDLGKVAHLHRRAGFGAGWSTLQRDLQAGPESSVTRLFQPRTATAEETQVIAGLREAVLEARDSERLRSWWLFRMAFDPDSLREKLTLFWHSHFATSDDKVKNVTLMLEQNELLRRLALGEFPVLLEEIARDRAMLLWLDGAGSSKEKPNENFARELLELFTLGIGRYTEADVRAAARAFTGWTHEPDDRRGPGKFAFDRKRFDAGTKSFLGRTGQWNAADVLRITLEQPAAAEFLCRKLYRFFVSETSEPGPELIGPLAHELRQSRYSITHVLQVIFRSQLFYSHGVRRERLRGPVEFSAGLLRALDVPRADVRLLALAATCRRQGQDLFHPPNVKGWEGGRSWVTSIALLERGNWVADEVWGNPDLGLRPFDPRAWSGRQGVAADKLVDAWIALLLQDDVPPAAREFIVRTGRPGDPNSLRKALQLILSCPEFQLA